VDKPLRVILADDHACVRLGVASLLHTTGRASVVGEACNALALATWLDTTECDVVIADLCMPGLHGEYSSLGVLRRLAQNEGAPAVVVLTMVSTPQVLTGLLQRGPAVRAHPVRACPARANGKSSSSTRRVCRSVRSRTGFSGAAKRSARRSAARCASWVSSPSGTSSTLRRRWDSSDSSRYVGLRILFPLCLSELLLFCLAQCRARFQNCPISL